ncbi:DUF5348 domain-containing protein [Paenibacillus sp. YN15]|uniref:DUF5348 domain-containing protein n=1 Tax=Paenibacillus sp. YN15 TaxID=1742774 RepID=UPI000DCC7B7A|nr:DUF5348 domain-containing protein [Paenibacillus sp. YN15]RAU92491.1 hypothetical protein DQG13_27565 [Paenibacillus sp. YN15]
MKTQTKSIREQIKSELEKLLPQMKRVVNLIEDTEDNWLDHYERLDPDDQFQRYMFYFIAESMQKAQRTIEIMKAPVVASGKLYKNSAGRYEYERGSYFTSGCPIEFLHEEEGRDPSWIHSRVEHNGSDYYIVGYPNLSMNGLFVRMRLRG